MIYSTNGPAGRTIVKYCFKVNADSKFLPEKVDLRACYLNGHPSEVE